jgi:photosystem II stability/assembly factor-like uncharacterized protein
MTSPTPVVHHSEHGGWVLKEGRSSPLNSPFDTSSVYAIAVSPNYAQDGGCFAACDSGLYRSEDGGFTWRFAYSDFTGDSPPTTTAVAISPDFATSPYVFAGGHGGILRSADGGVTWSLATLPTPPPLVSTLVVSPQFVQDGTVFAGTVEDGVFRSNDRGTHWTAWNFGLLDLSIFALAVSPNFSYDDTLFAGTEIGIFRSTNGGRAWREVAFPIDHAPVLSLALSPGYAEDGILYAGTETHGLLRSDDRGHIWRPIAEGQLSGSVNAITLAPTFPRRLEILIQLDDTVLVSHDGGGSWSERVTLPAQQRVAAVAAPQGFGRDTTLLVGLVEGGVQRV